jgi:Nif-specific regulatory protein
MLAGAPASSPSDLSLPDKSLKTALDSFKKEYVTQILEENGWNQTKTARILGIQRTYVIRLINELHIQKK